MKTPIRAGLRENSPLQASVHNGIRALKRAHVALLAESIRAAFADSLDLDEALRVGRDGENRWDYLLGHRDSRRIVGLEPHTANNHEIAAVIKKREAALRHLRENLADGVAVAEWLWVAAGRVDFLPLEKATLRLASHGIRFVGTQLLGRELAKLAPSPGLEKRRPRRT